MKQKPKDEQVIDILKRLTKRVEAATVDIHEIKIDLKWQKIKVGSIENSTNIMKVDIENTREDMEAVKKDIKDIKRETHDLTLTTGEILANMVTQEEHKSLSKRVSALEHQ